MSTPRVATVAAGAPFLETLVAACRSGALGVDFGPDERDFSAATIYVPTRRAARALAHAFAEALQPKAVLLPRIVPLGDPDDAEVKIALAGTGEDMLAPAIGALDRRLLLTRLIEAWRNGADFRRLAEQDDGFTLGEGFADAFMMAGDLARLIDEFATEGADWAGVRELAPERFDAYWGATRDFLMIAGEAWPAMLAERGLMDPVARQNHLLRLEAKRLLAAQPTAPVIAAGSTGSVPATAVLLAAIARLPNGAVVLPGLDLAMDSAGWELVPASDADLRAQAQPGHPQAVLKQLLSRLGVMREDVAIIGAPDAAAAARAAIVAASSRAADATDDWPGLRAQLGAGLDMGLAGVALIETADERLEATAVAVALREALETPGRTAALMTPDRGLARRVMAELMRWGVVADDSAGRSLAETAVGAAARLLPRVVVDGYAPALVVAALRAVNPEADAALATIEIAGLRGFGVGEGLDGLSRILAETESRRAHPHAGRPLRRLADADIAAARALLDNFATAMRPLAILGEGQHPLRSFVEAHLHALRHACAEDMLAGPEGAALARVMDELATAQENPAIRLDDYSLLAERLLMESAVPPPQPAQGRVKIWGLLEARLVEADLVVLGGLNEGTWPQTDKGDAFLNRAMRQALGLPQPERRIGQSAHDFCMALGAPEVVLTRALAVEGTPTVASRFIRRLEAFVGTNAASSLRQRGDRLVAAAKALDDAEPVQPAPRPAPRPAAHLQPASLSVTEIATLYRDPYAIHARHVLRLDPLEPLGDGIDARDRGEIVHAVLARFIADTPGALPPDALARITAMGEEAFAPFLHDESVAAFWWPRFLAAAEWFVGWERERREAHPGLVAVTEASGRFGLTLADGTAFTLRGRADRIDVFEISAGGQGLGVLDYKTGAAPGRDEVAIGLEPQLTLQAAMAVRGAFAGVPAAPAVELGYITVGSTPDDRMLEIAKAPETLDSVATKHLESLISFLSRLRAGEETFLSRRRPRKQDDEGPYDHLARAREWLSSGGDE
ncbi:MAG: double-strand break repair protein AddB [Beijerinckiaceae bacterium]